MFSTQNGRYSTALKCPVSCAQKASATDVGLVMRVLSDKVLFSGYDEMALFLPAAARCLACAGKLEEYQPAKRCLVPGADGG